MIKKRPQKASFFISTDLLEQTEDMIKNRIEKNLKRLKSWVTQNQIEAYRIYDWDIPEYPFQIDRYGQTCLIHDKSLQESARDQKHLAEAKQALCEIFGDTTEIVMKKRFQQREGDKSKQYEKLGQTGQRFEIQEGKLRFWVNVHDYIDTGLFLDHRPLRKMVAQGDLQKAPGKFLNLFSYTCSLSVAAATAGLQTMSVDLSEKYLNWGKDNFRLNQLDPQKHLFVAQNAMDFLKQSALEGEFDLIFLDPPTFSNSKKMTDDFEVERDQIDLLKKTTRLLKPGGLLIFSNNKRSFKLAPEVVQSYQIKDITLKTIPQDFQSKKIHQCYEIRLPFSVV